MGNLCFDSEKLLNFKFINKNKITQSEIDLKKRNIHEQKLFRSDSTKKNFDDFDILKYIGRGAFGLILLCREKATKSLYCIKLLSKQKIAAEGISNERIIIEKKILSESCHPRIVDIYCAFQDENFLYLVLDYMPGGSLDQYLFSSSVNKNINRIKFYGLQILEGLEYLHNKNIIYRDLKPGNILLDQKGNIKICDFGLSKYGNRADSICGTPEYIAPEIINGKKTYNKVVDYWSLGCILYQMATGYTPFSSNATIVSNKESLFNRIKKAVIRGFPANINDQLKDLIIKLLNPNPNNRLGSNGLNEIRNHPFFKNCICEQNNFKIKEEFTKPFKIKWDNKTTFLLKSIPKHLIIQLIKIRPIKNNFMVDNFSFESHPSNSD